jgi:hypothetical protein
MKDLDAYFRVPEGEIRKKVSEMVSSLEVRDFDVDFWRKRIGDDFKIQKITLNDAGETGFVGADSSITTQNLRYHALWSMHCISLYGLYNGMENEDPLVGQGSIPYSNLMYDSSVELGSFTPYWMLEQQMNCIRIAKEYSSLVENCKSLAAAGRKVDFALVDGSLKTNMENISIKASLKAVDEAVSAQEKLLGLKKVVSMVEDSHASDISRKFGLNMSNLMMFHLLLKEGEYVVDADGFNVCYIKLPGKKLTYMDAESKPLTARWEFSYPHFEEDLNSLASIWLKEDDLLHPQIYPLRIADYLTRQIKTSGLLNEVVSEINPDLEFRDMREANFE